ncbi:MAG TPA: hypothetical protein VFV81_02280 [Verrucomicrobiae bacterium]|nr:hypothetical protein [Verrucomicrobiae bacterium]
MSHRTEQLGALKAAIVLKHRCDASHAETVHVQELMKGGQVVWDGDVEVFHLRGHPTATICYAWSHLEPAGVRIMTVLGSFLIDSAQKAVRAAIFADVEHFEPSAGSPSQQPDDFLVLDWFHDREDDALAS